MSDTRLQGYFQSFQLGMGRGKSQNQDHSHNLYQSSYTHTALIESNLSNEQPVKTPSSYVLSTRFSTYAIPEDHTRQLFYLKTKAKERNFVETHIPTSSPAEMDP